MTYSGLIIETTVHDTTDSSHAIPAYPEYNSKTTFDDAFYAERRLECDRLIGAAVDYVDDPNQGPGAGGGAVDLTGITIDGPATIDNDGAKYAFHFEGTNEDEVINDYKVTWTVPGGEGTIWGYASDPSDMQYVQVYGKNAGGAGGTVTCTFVERGNSANTVVKTKAFTFNP